MSPLLKQHVRHTLCTSVAVLLAFVSPVSAEKAALAYQCVLPTAPVRKTVRGNTTPVTEQPKQGSRKASFNMRLFGGEVTNSVMQQVAADKIRSLSLIDVAVAKDAVSGLSFPHLQEISAAASDFGSLLSPEKFPNLKWVGLSKTHLTHADLLKIAGLPKLGA